MDFIIKIFTVEMVAVVVTQKSPCPSVPPRKARLRWPCSFTRRCWAFSRLRGLLRVSTLSLMLWCAFAFASGVSFLRSAAAPYSLMSLLLLLIISTFYVFRIELDREHYLKWLKPFR